MDLSSAIQCDITQELICKVNIINLEQERTDSQLLLPVLTTQRIQKISCLLQSL